jgi:hypothetical protein
MKLRTIIISLSVLFALSTQAQNEPKADDLGRIIINAYLPEQPNLTAESKNFLETKLNQITTNYGIGGSEVNPRFIITASIQVVTQDIIAGPPQMIAINIDVTLFIGDAIENRLYSNAIISLKGVGTNETKALINALKKIDTKDNQIAQLIEKSKAKIVAYYETECTDLLNEALVLQHAGKYDEAIYKLSIVPNICSDCYSKCSEAMVDIYQQKANEEGVAKLQQAKLIWISNQNREGAEQAGELLSQIPIGANCQNEVSVLTKEITNKLKSDEKAAWNFKMKCYSDNMELDKIRLNASREIAIEFAKNQPKIIYHTINWK